MANKFTTKTNRTGVSIRLSSNRYVASIEYNGKTKSKTFDTFEEAVKQREEYEKERNEFYKMTKPSKAKVESTHKLCTNNCRDCKYMKWLTHIHNDDSMYCDYYLMTEHRRPCGAGDGCTVKKPRAKNHNQLRRCYQSDTFIYTDEEQKMKRMRVTKDLNLVEV